MAIHSEWLRNNPPMAPRGPKGPFTLGPWARGPLGPPLAPIQSLGSLGIPCPPPQGSRSSRGDNVASREMGKEADIAGAYKQVGGYARSVDELYFGLEKHPAGAVWADQIVF